MVAGPATPTGLTVDMSDISDTFMTLAAVAPFASSPVTITGIANVRLKESDRIAAMESNLRRLGVRTESGPDFLRVYPGTPTGGRVDPHGDHRIAMSFAVLGLRARGVVVEDPGCVSKTCPGLLRALVGARTGNSLTGANRGHEPPQTTHASPSREGEHGRRHHGQVARRDYRTTDREAARPRPAPPTRQRRP